MKNLSTFIFFIFWSMGLFSQSLPWPAESPFSDSYGYTWKTNSASGGPVFNWIDITQIGNEVTGLSDDNTVGPISIGMDFPFYWVTRDQIWIGDNGYISFSSNIPIASNANGFPLIPSHDDTDDILAPFMVDMDAGGNNNPTKVYTYFDSANQQFIVSYHDIPFFANNATGFAGANTFQIILNGQDSSITFQYLKQEGNWDPAYNGAPYPFVVGIENLTGNMGLMPTGIPIDATLKPRDSTAIRFYAPETPQFLIPDAEITWVENEESAGSFFPWRPSAAGPEPKHTAVALLTNSGLVDIDTPLFIAANYSDPRTGESLHRDTLPVAFLNQNESRYLIFKKPFYPPRADNYSLEISIINPEAYGDLNAFNDTKVVDIVALDTTKNQVEMTYALQLPSASFFGTSFLGKGVYFEPHGYPVDVIALEYYVLQTQTPKSGFRIQLFKSDPDQETVPGPILYQNDIPAEQVPNGGGWMKIDMPIPFRIDSLGFYVGWVSLGNSTTLVSEETPPISLRSYDILDDGWVISRNNNSREPLIKAIVEIDNAVATVGVGEEIEPLDWQVFPNPSSGQLSIRLNQADPEKMALKITDLQGRKVHFKFYPPTLQLDDSIDLSHLPNGVYSVQLIKEGKIFTRQWVKRD